MIINRLKFRTKQALVYEKIRRGIITGEYASGARLVITHLAKELGVSESPMREALKQLVSENFAVEQGVNLYVAPLSRQQFLDMLDVRLQLEKIALQRAVLYIDQEGVEKLRNYVEKMKNALRENDMTEYNCRHKQFHLECLSYCNIPYLFSALIEAADHHERGVHLFGLKNWRVEPDVDQHSSIVDALEHRDGRMTMEEWEKNRELAFIFYREQLSK